MTTPTLSPSERRILAMESRGYTDAEIARDYQVSIERIREIKAAAKAKIAAPVSNGGEYWNR
jgi:DNA-directed RNA polymerase sigma subunit (sigma70/sigma32)